jgi:uncharacterized SAM-binding protein YcdF (DUF218 family)
VLVRIRAEVQEVPRAVSPEASGPVSRRRDLAILGAAVAVGVVLVASFATYRIWEQGDRDEVRPAGAIVVLGAAQYDGRPSPVFAARLDHAIELYGEGYAPLLVVTGGKQPGDRVTEAETARRYAIARGIPEDAIVTEDEGRTTLASLGSVAAMLAARGVDDALFVSDPTHMLRVLRIADDAGLTAWGSPTRTSPVDADVGRRIEATTHELGALALYFVARGGSTDPATGG